MLSSDCQIYQLQKDETGTENNDDIVLSFKISFIIHDAK